MDARALNRTLLLRQGLLERRDDGVDATASRLLALQAQWAPSPYVALWSRLASVDKNEVTALVKATTLRTTVHVQTHAWYPRLASAWIESRRGRTENRGYDVAALRQAMPKRPLERGEAEAIVARVIGTDERWAVAFALRTLPFVRASVVGSWPHTKAGLSELWREPLPDAAESAVLVVHAFVAAYGPVTRDEIERFTAFRIRQIAPALETLEEQDGRYDVAGAPRATGRERAPVRFLPAFDSMLLAHLYNGRVLAPEHVDAVYNRKNAMCKSTFLVDGYVAGIWRVERERLVVEPFAPLSPKARREVDAEGARLLEWWLDG
ncbi:MAG TPA: crosslink repair DNA glycosylase YcaQ family protein [Gaiellaceae bacterium]